MRKTHIMLLVVVLPLLATACRRESTQSHLTDFTEPNENARMEMGMGMGAAGGGGEVAMGEVVDTMDGGKYTYVQIDTGVEKIWGASPACEVKLGDKLGISKTQPMPNWRSPTLDREFDLVYFVNGFQKPDGTFLGGGHGMAGQPSMGRAAGPSDVEVGSIEKAEGGKTVAEIHAEKAELADKEVIVRGQVTKYNAAIMQKNWLHVQDGSGDKAAQTHDLTVTTTATAKVGDVVLVTGKLVLNKDFGYGYSYAIIIEDAEVVVE